MLYTVSAVQTLVMLDAVDELDSRIQGGKHKVAECMIIRTRLLQDVY